MTSTAAVAITATDLERHDHEVARHKILHGIPDLGHPAGGLVTQCEGSGQAGPAADDDEIKIAARHGKGLHQRVAGVQQPRLRHVPPLDSLAVNIGKLSHPGSSPRVGGECKSRSTRTKGLSSTVVNIFH